MSLVIILTVVYLIGVTGFILRSLFPIWRYNHVTPKHMVTIDFFKLIKDEKGSAEVFIRWLQDNIGTFNYQIEYNNGNAIVRFYRKTDAVAFKLRWI